ncbi:MAG: NusG domain II-containing protein [Clostridia bacterium]|nr:NusG domain II-containing protein [Clostridia bacterium]
MLAAVLLLTACRAKPSGGARVLLDGREWSSGSVAPESEDALRVYVTWDGAALIDLPFGEAHRVQVLQPDGEENEIVLTGDEVYMERANCENQDCVEMGRVTRDNYELRAMGGFIICLPHRVSVEVRGE